MKELNCGKTEQEKEEVGDALVAIYGRLHHNTQHSFSCQDIITAVESVLYNILGSYNV